VVAQVEQGAFRALWLAGITQGPAVPDHLMRKGYLVVFGDLGHEIEFDLDRVTLFGQTDAL